MKTFVFGRGYAIDNIAFFVSAMGLCGLLLISSSASFSLVSRTRPPNRVRREKNPSTSPPIAPYSSHDGREGLLITLHEEKGKGVTGPSSTSLSWSSNERGRHQQHTTNDNGIPYRVTIQALRAYRSEHGNLVMPRRYTIADDDENYPVEYRGRDLPGHVYDMGWWQRHVRSHPDRVEELNDLGFVWGRLQPEWNLIMEALVAYSERNGHVAVPVGFVVPADRGWSDAIVGLPLGRCVNQIRCRQDWIRGRPDRVAQLHGLRFVWDARERSFQKFRRVLECYAVVQRRRGNPSAARTMRATQWTVPVTYVVPHGPERGFPEDCWGYPLGARCAAVLQRGVYVSGRPDRVEALEALGFGCQHGAHTLGWLETVHAAAIYSQMHGRVLDVPQNFVVPAAPPSFTLHQHYQDGGDRDGDVRDDWPWPEHLWGFPLGVRLRDIRLAGRYLRGPKEEAKARVAQLDTLGFVWTPKRGRKKRVIACPSAPPSPPSSFQSDAPGDSLLSGEECLVTSVATPHQATIGSRS